MKCAGCGADLSENATICPYCDTVVVPERNQKNEESLDSNAKSTFGSKIKNAITASWRKMDLFSKSGTVIAFLIAILTVVATAAKNRGAIIISILQIAALVVAVLMYKGTIKTQKKWFSYIVLGVAILLSMANIACYSANKRPQNDTTRPPVQASEQKETKVYTPYNAKDCVGKTETDIEKGFRQAGFTNISKDLISDLEIEDSAKDGSVESVTINGVSDFSGNEEFLSTARVVIRYHSFKRIEAPIDSEIAKTTNAEELVQLFKDAGFVDITSDEVVDLDPDSTSGEFENLVSIDGISSFTHTASFPVNATIDIVTHRVYEKYTLKVVVDFVPNLIFSKYDVDLDVNGEITRLSHGEDGKFEYRLKPGKYAVTFTSAESSSVKGTTEIDLTGDTEISYKIHCYNDKITVETLPQDYLSDINEDDLNKPKDKDEETTEIEQEKTDTITTDSSLASDDKTKPEETADKNALTDSEVKDAICALMDTSLDSSTYHVNVEGSLVNIYCYPEGLTLSVYNATVNKDKEAIKTWNSLVKSSKEFNKSISDDVHNIMGRKDLRVALYYYDDSGTSEMVFLCIMDGVVFYDIVNGIDLLGLG